MALLAGSLGEPVIEIPRFGSRGRVPTARLAAYASSEVRLSPAFPSSSRTSEGQNPGSGARGQRRAGRERGDIPGKSPAS
jgi:hypothetical protein